ncbi:unnamed protein product [Nippostrongylus brasiliensis]|uniref:tRNA pseudouridine(55) synthase n=1 Tax=Nippostrongylus brasiliensis TaxID=27835 RepID=A0A0N4Y5M6_NIPBR|nr:unnamed protein product [Nippostrongylus brasiliensis]
MAVADAVENPGTLRFCTLCRRQIAGEETADVDVVQNSYECVLCFGLLDQDFIQKVADAVAAQLKDTPYDATACTLALNLPISQTLREVIVRKSRPDLNGILIAVPYKIRNIDAYLPKLREATGLRLTLSSDLRLTVAFENDEFCQYDTQFLKEHFPENFLQGKKRKFGQDEPSAWTKIKVEQILGRIREDIARKYSLSSPTRPCTFSISFERDPVYVAGRYCKYSRSLPQSPWSVEDKAAPKEPGNSMCACLAMGDLLPLSCVIVGSQIRLREEREKTLRRLEEEINAQRDIKVKYLTRITQKRKHYTAYCYSTLPISDEALASAMKSAPVELIQRTPVRVLKRRALLDRPRTVYTLEILRMDSHHFLMRPSLADLLNVSNGEIDILDLDVEKVDFDWPPNSTGKSFS